MLEVALDNDIQLSHDCKMGVCMTCPAKKVSGELDQGASILSEEAQEKGYVLLCVGYPRSDLEIQTISEKEI